MLFQHPRPPKPIHHWFLNPVAITRLREITEDPVFQLACATLLAAAMPTRHSTSSDPERNSLAHSWLAGYRDFQNDLAALTVMPGPKGPPADEWLHVTPPEV